MCPKQLFVGSDNYKFHAYRISDLRPTERKGFWAMPPQSKVGLQS
jgi:hypothetical protein